MCKNAMLYNAPDTIYYKSAEKLLNLGVSALTGVSVACLVCSFFTFVPILRYIRDMWEAKQGCTWGGALGVAASPFIDFF